MDKPSEKPNEKQTDKPVAQAPVAPTDDHPFSFRWLLIALGTVTALYIGYVVIQYSRLNEFNQRQLANAATELFRTIETAKRTVENFGSSGSQKPLCDFDLDQPYLDVIGKCNTQATPTGAKLAIEQRRLAINAGNINFEFRADTLLKELSFPESFQIIFFTDEKGSVLYQDEPAQRLWRRQLRWGEQEFRDSGADSRGGPQIRDLAVAMGKAQGATWEQLRSMTGLTTLTLGSTRYQVYLQPITLQDDVKLVLGGMVPTESVIRRALAVDTYFSALLVLVFLLGLLGLPFVKLAVLDKHERFSRLDVDFLYLSTVALIALLTFVVVGVDGYLRWRQVANEGLSALAENLRTHYQNEIAGVVNQLDDYDRIVSTWSTAEKCPGEYPVGDWFNESNAPLQVSTGLMNLEVAAWIDPSGMQTWKVTADRNAANIDVSNRPYYRAVRDGNLVQMAQIHQEKPFYISTDRSVTDGRFKTFIAFRSDVKKLCSTDGPFTAFAAANVLSLDRVPLPAGYGFMMVNREGRVLYHSDGRLSLRENFFSEIRDPTLVKALMFADQAETFSTRYREQPHEFFLLPLQMSQAGSHDQAGLFLAVFRDRSIERATVTLAFITSIACTAALLTPIILLGLGGIVWASKSRKQNWRVILWPHGGLEGFYKLLTAAFLGVLLLGILLFYALNKSEVVFLVMPVVAATCGILIYRSREKKDETRKPMETPFWQTAQITLLLICMVVAPSAAVLRLVLRHDFGRMIKAEQQRMKEQEADLDLALRAEVRAAGYSKIGDTIASARKAYLPGEIIVPYDTDFSTADAPSWLMNVPNWVEKSLPIPNDIMARQRAHKLHAGYFPPVRALNEVWIAIAAFAGIAALVWWIRWNSTRIFHVDLMSHKVAKKEEYKAAWEDPSLPKEKQYSLPEKLLLIQVAEGCIANPMHEPELVAGLVNKGLLKLDPDLKPSSEELRKFLLGKKEDMQQELSESENVSARHSWRYVRWILGVGLAGLALFLAATQPGWHSAVLGIATAVTTLLTTLLKMQDVVLQWLKAKKA